MVKTEYDFECDLLTFIEGHVLLGNYLKQMQKIAEDVLSLIPSSAGLELIFSSLGFVHDETRNRLSIEKANKLAFFSDFCSDFQFRVLDFRYVLHFYVYEISSFRHVLDKRFLCLKRLKHNFYRILFFFRTVCGIHRYLGGHKRCCRYMPLGVEDTVAVLADHCPRPHTHRLVFLNSRHPDHTQWGDTTSPATATLVIQRLLETQTSVSSQNYYHTLVSVFITGGAKFGRCD